MSLTIKRRNYKYIINILLFIGICATLCFITIISGQPTKIGFLKRNILSFKMWFCDNWDKDLKKCTYWKPYTRRYNAQLEESFTTDQHAVVMDFNENVYIVDIDKMYHIPHVPNPGFIQTRQDTGSYRYVLRVEEARG